MKLRSLLYTAIVIISLTTAAYAAEALLDTSVKNIQLIEIKDGKAILKGTGGARAEVVVGDIIGREKGKVVEIRNTFITVETGEMKIKIGMAFHFEK